MNLDYMDMLQYVKNILIQNNGIRSQKPQLYFRSRYEHIERVLGWTKRIAKEVKKCNLELLYTAAIFHDCGYTNRSEEPHALLGAEIFKRYALRHNFPEPFIQAVSDMISRHSDKGLLMEEGTPIEMVILLEADLIDEEGTLGIVFDLLAAGHKTPTSYAPVFEEIMLHSAHILNQCYMVTPAAKRIWEEKKQFINLFIQCLKYDLFIE